MLGKIIYSRQITFTYAFRRSGSREDFQRYTLRLSAFHIHTHIYLHMSRGLLNPTLHINIVNIYQLNKTVLIQMLIQC